jgi:hypothetical protein
LAEQEAIDKLPAVLEKMRYLQIEPNETSYNYLVKAAAHAGNV